MMGWYKSLTKIHPRSELFNLPFDVLIIWPTVLHAVGGRYDLTLSRIEYEKFGGS